MNVVLVTPFQPPMVGGGPARTAGILEGLQLCGHTVDVVHLPVRKPVWARRYRPWWYFLPSQAWTRGLGQKAQAADLLVACYLPAAHACLAALPQHGGCPFVYDADNDEAGLAEQVRRRYAARLVSKMEEVVVRRADAVWVAGSRDAASLKERYRWQEIIDVPNGVTPLPDLSSVSRSLGTAFIYGSWNYPPNRDGLLRLARSATDIPGTIDVYGRYDLRFAQQVQRAAEKAQPNLRWTFCGFRPEISDFAGSGAAAIIPVWAGAGTKLRAVQLASMGVPAVLTPEAASGLPEWFRSMGVIEDEPVRLLERALYGALPDSQTRRLFRSRVNSELSWQALVEHGLTTLARHSTARG